MRHRHSARGCSPNISLHVRYFDQPKVTTLVMTQTADANNPKLKPQFVVLYGLYVRRGWEIRMELGLISAEPGLNSRLRLSTL